MSWKVVLVLKTLGIISTGDEQVSICNGILWHWDLWCSSWCRAMRPVFQFVSISILCQSARLGQRWCCSLTYSGTTFETPGMFIRSGCTISCTVVVYGLVWVMKGVAAHWMCQGSCGKNVKKNTMILIRKYFRNRFIACHKNRAYCRCNRWESDVAVWLPLWGLVLLSINLSCVIVLIHYVTMYD